jgi:Antitoxin VbhA
MRGLSSSKGRDEIDERRAIVGEVLAGLRADGLEPSSDMLRDVERYAVGQIDAVEFVTRTMDRAARRPH